VYGERFKRGNIWQQVMDTSSPVREQHSKRRLQVRECKSSGCGILIEMTYFNSINSQLDAKIIILLIYKSYCSTVQFL